MPRDNHIIERGQRGVIVGEWPSLRRCVDTYECFSSIACHFTLCNEYDN